MKSRGADCNEKNFTLMDCPGFRLNHHMDFSEFCIDMTEVIYEPG